MAKEKKYIFGPVPSRRLGRSLGVDIVPFKTCSLNCVYCQLGRTTDKSLERKAFVDVEAVLNELREKVEGGVEADYITISGSGEPTLNINLGEIIDGIRKITNIPVAIITNGTLLYMADVRSDCKKADLVVPSLNSADVEVFEKINRPHEGINLETVIDGLSKFRDEFKGQIWLEVFLIEGVNTSKEEILRLSDAIKKIRPNKIQLNTAVRPTAETGVSRVGEERLKEIAHQIGPDCEVVADFTYRQNGRIVEKGEKSVLAMLIRRPCSLQDICEGLGLNHIEAAKYIANLEKNGAVYGEELGGKIFYRAK